MQLRTSKPSLLSLWNMPIITQLHYKFIFKLAPDIMYYEEVLIYQFSLTQFKLDAFFGRTSQRTSPTFLDGTCQKLVLHF